MRERASERESRRESLPCESCGILLHLSSPWPSRWWGSQNCSSGVSPLYSPSSGCPWVVPIIWAGMCVCTCSCRRVTVDCEGLETCSKSIKPCEQEETFLTSLGFLPALVRNLDAPLLNCRYTALKCEIQSI